MFYMVLQLFSDTVPKTAENFRALCACKIRPGPMEGQGGRSPKAHSLEGCDFFKCDGSHGESIDGGKFPVMAR
ncbi:putative peptidylprolyl isomerase [Helianthus debilis subsp. tardiflorus]